MSNSIETFETERLCAQRMRSEHFDDLQRMHADVRVMATLGGLRGAAETRALIESNDAHWERHGYGLWVFRDTDTDVFAGRGGIRHVEVAGVAEIEVAYALVADSWDRGLATEMALALVRLSFEDLRIDDLVCFTMVTNQASRRVMEKAGFRYERDIVRAGLPHVLYRLRRAS